MSLPCVRKALSFTLVLLILVACGGQKSNILGKWKEAGGEDLAFEFFDGGKMTLTSDGRQFAGTYEQAHSDQIRMVLSGDLGEQEYLLTNVKVGDGKLSGSLNGVSVEMIRPAASQGASADVRLSKATGTSDARPTSAKAQEQVTQVDAVAIVNGTNITLTDYQKAVKFDWAQNAQDAADPSGSSVTVLDTLVDNQLLREQARQKGITVSQQEVTDAIEHDFGYYSVPPTATPKATATPTNTPGPTPTNTPGPSPTPTAARTATPSPTPAPTATPVTLQAYQDAYKQFLTRLTQQTGMSEADFRQVVETDLLKQRLYTQLTNNVSKTAAEIRVRHILVAIRTPEPTSQPTPPRDDAQALARIVEVQQKLGAGGDFAALAKEYSDDPGSAQQGGELGWVGKGQGLDTAFETAAFALKVGEISQPVKSSFGYHIIQVEENDPNHALDSYTYQQKQYEAYQTWLTALRAAATVDRKWTLEKIPPTPSVPLR